MQSRLVFVITTLGRPQLGHHELNVHLSYFEVEVWGTEERWGGGGRRGGVGKNTDDCVFSDRD